MSIDEAKSSNENPQVGAVDLHPYLDRQSRVEVLSDGGHSRTDPKTAHAAAGDPGYTRSIPESCLLCEATAVAQAQAGAAPLQAEMNT